MAGISEVVTALSAISSIAVIAWAGFIVIQLRQNVSILNATLRQQKEDAAFAMLERLTDESFSRRRANFYKVIEKGKRDGWNDFDDSPEDFEIRNYAYLYELYGQLVKQGMIGFEPVAEMLQYLVVFDWKEFEPVAKHYRDRWELINWWRNFEWLAGESEKYMSKREKTVRSEIQRNAGQNPSKTE